MRRFLIAAIFAVVVGTFGSAAAGQHYSVAGYTVSIEGGQVSITAPE